MVVPWRASSWKKLRRFFARFRSGKIAFDRKNMLAQPGKKFALAARDGGILRQVRVAIDQPGKNRDRAAIDPINRLRLRHSAQIVVIARGEDPAIFDDDGAITPAAQGAEIRGVNEETSYAKKVAFSVHRGRAYENITAQTGNTAVRRPIGQKKIRAAHAKEKQQIQTNVQLPESP